MLKVFADFQFCVKAKCDILLSLAQCDTFNAEDPDNPGSNYYCPDGFNTREEEMTHQCAQSVCLLSGWRPGALH